MTDLQITRTQTRSECIHRAASSVMPTEAQASTNAARVRTPVLTRASGAVVTDVDGNDYIDYTGADGATILGHADARVTVAITKAVAKGLQFPSPTESQVRLAEIVASRFSAIDTIAFTGSTTDARRDAVTCAMEHTGRTRIIATSGELAVPGDRVSIAVDDAQALVQAFDEHGPLIAAVIIEPVATGAGLVVTDTRFLTAARALCDEHGALMILDECTTAFHLAASAARPWGHVTPDLTVFGTIIGGGLSLAAYGGRRQVMQSHGSQGARSVSGLPLSVAAGLATLEALTEPGSLDGIDALACGLDEGLLAAAASTDIATQHARFANMVGLYFTATPRKHPAFVASLDAARFVRFYHAMLDRGVLVPGHPAACFHVTMAHTVEQIDRTVEAAHEALATIG